MITRRGPFYPEHERALTTHPLSAFFSVQRIFIVFIMLLSLHAAVVWAEDIDELCSAAAMGDMAKVRAMVAGAPHLVKESNADGFTALHYAVMGDQMEVVKYLVAKKADVNARGTNDWTPLHMAARKAHTEIAEYLLDRGAFVNALDRDGMTPLKIAKKNGNESIIKMLRAHRGRE